MQIIALLIVISLTIALVFLGVFIWNLRSGQYEDTFTPSIRMLFDSKKQEPETKEAARKTKGNEEIKS
jgi:cbb3-type cytochrome oxidase maturation protein